jgi:hypothetical protein
MAKDETKKAPAIYLFDRDDFYKLTLELVLFNLGVNYFYYYSSERSLLKFRQSFSKQTKGGIYILEEFFMNFEKQKQLLSEIKKTDPEGIIICFTVSDPEHVENKEFYDHVVLKSSRSTESTIIQKLSEILGVEFVSDNSDPEVDGD